ncbi:hypothetical protein F4825DRAFT_449939 [Nemania diffusa]|nr:hypothetical protein F4825DRAFT_449939 [Nemania diffusa]
MPRKIVGRDAWEAEKEKRLARQDIRTSYRTDATETEKEASLRVACSKLGGKKYSWLPEGPTTVAGTLGQQRAIALGIKSGKIAEELKIGEFRDEIGPERLSISWEELRAAGINMSKKDFEKSLRDSGAPEEEIRAALAAKPKKTVGKSAASARQRSTSATSEKTPPVPPVEETQLPPNAAPAKKRGRKRAAAEDEDADEPRPVKKQRTKKKATPEPAESLATPPQSSASDTAGTPLLDVITIVNRDNEDDNKPAFAPSSPTISELEALLEEEDKPAFAPPSPTISELEALLEEEEDKQTVAPSSPTISELEALLEEEEEDKPAVSPPSPTISELEALLEEEE